MSRSSQAHKQSLFFSSVWTQHFMDQILTERKKRLNLIAVSQTEQSSVIVTPSLNVPVRQRNSTPAQQRCLAQISELQVNLTSRWGMMPVEKHKCFKQNSHRHGHCWVEVILPFQRLQVSITTKDQNSNIQRSRNLQHGSVQLKQSFQNHLTSWRVIPSTFQTPVEYSAFLSSLTCGHTEVKSLNILGKCLQRHYVTFSSHYH